ncbi:YiiX/YebB-like N1pC/P60 family cysteine hydrolase [Candidatus Puniceispirillum sp.]|jgi:hypothetical protein|uniref:YiiX/YebB-like N1pC/P60 family cysteine hydrolase n=1 Tax=Candidatus Puniceispirillum sp. TaxID=2026719 RepID=UPI001ECE6CEC|nr:lipo-like protein [Candidatus Puniceispirillum sp.]
MQSILRYFGDRLARHLSKPKPGYERFSVLSQAQLAATLEPCDLLLVEGNSQISTAIKYLTQSTWSHVCLFVGDQDGQGALLEADLVNGVCRVPLSKYDGYNVRICRPVRVTDEDKRALINFAIERIGHQYDTKNIIDLLRYLIATPPVPSRYRRSLIAFGSGDPTKAICSTLVAQSFQSIKYPILPRELSVQEKKRFYNDQLVMQKRHYSHFTPRDFDLSPYFQIIKPTISNDFDYQDIKWDE